MAWYLAPSLAVLRAEVNARWPSRDKTSDGTIGDAAHAATRSDHNPNSRESVDAWDMDKDGVDVDEVIAAFQKHPSAHYWIWQRQIADKDDGWRRRPYSGSNPHDRHVHFSIRQNATAEQNLRSWGLEDDMPLTNDDALTVWELNAGSSTNPIRAIDRLNQTAADVRTLRTEVAELRTQIATPITDEQLERVLRKVLGSVDGDGVSPA